jgi:hypothetical protein
MLRKLSFTALAIAMAWVLSSAMYDNWTSGYIHVPEGRYHRPAFDYSYYDGRALFLFKFFARTLGALCAVFLVLFLGWNKKRDVKTRPAIDE